MLPMDSKLLLVDYLNKLPQVELYSFLQMIIKEWVQREHPGALWVSLVVHLGPDVPDTVISLPMPHSESVWPGLRVS